MSRSERFLKACRGEAADCTPVWFMRQAGRYMKSYQEIRARYPLIEMFRTPGLATEVTLQPVRAFPIDAAIIFADILLPLEGMGIGFEFTDSHGPVISRPVRSAGDIKALRVADPEEDLGYVLEAVRNVRGEIDGKVPLIGFAGAPFTLAGYAIEGGGSSNHLLTKRVMYEQPEAWDLLMDKMCRTLIPFLKAQVRAGAQVVQLFDSWVGCLDPSDYERYVLEHTRKIFRELRAEGIPSIHFGTGTAGLLPLMAQAGGRHRGGPAPDAGRGLAAGGAGGGHPGEPRPGCATGPRGGSGPQGGRGARFRRRPSRSHLQPWARDHAPNTRGCGSGRGGSGARALRGR